MRAIKDQHRQRASLVSTDGAKVWDSFVPDEFLRVGGKLEKVLGKEVHFFTPFWALWRKFGESFGENFCENSPRGWWAFEENSLKFAKKKQDATPVPPRLGPTNSPPARHRLTGPHTVWSSCHYVIMP